MPHPPTAQHGRERHGAARRDRDQQAARGLWIEERVDEVLGHAADLDLVTVESAITPEPARHHVRRGEGPHARQQPGLARPQEQLGPDYNVAPTKKVYAVIDRPPRDDKAAPPRRELAVVRWGLVPDA